MKIFLLTQEDAFYIPKLLDTFFSRLPADVQVAGAAILKGEISRKNALNFFNFLGPKAFLHNSFLYASHRAMDLVDRRGTGLHSVRGALQKHNVAIHRPSNINDATFHELLRQKDVALLVSIACPQIVRKELLALPPKGCINIHGALLPKYRGRMPSFWVLAKGETQTGVTVHYMNEKVDDGPIIVRKEVPIAPDDTLHSLVLKSKVGYGAEALAEAVMQLARDQVSVLENDAAQATYFSFPTKEAVREFRKRGRTFR